MIGMESILLTSGLIFSLVLSNYPTKDLNSYENVVGSGL